MSHRCIITHPVLTSNSVQIIALTKCQLRVVQASRTSPAFGPNKNTDPLSVVGSILSNLRMGTNLHAMCPILIASLVLVLGMCFFAGGLRYSEQGFGKGAYRL